MSESILTLETGQYLAPRYSNFDANGLIVGHTHYAKPTKTGIWHRHKNPLLSYVLDGGNVENRARESFERISGCVNFYNAYEPHQNIYKTFPSRHVSIEMEPDFLIQNDLDALDIAHSFQSQKKEAFQFAKILKETFINDGQSKDTITMLFLELCNKTNFQNSIMSPPWVNTIRTILHDRWNEKVALVDLANETGVHPITISKNFRKHFSYTLGEYCRIFRIEKAMTLMRSQNSSLSEIAYSCGFSDQSHFIRTFKTHTGFRPKDYKKIL